MIFKPDLAQKVLAGEKTVTRRLVSDNPRSPWWRGHCSLVVGKDYAVCPGRGKTQIGRVRIISVDRMGLWPMTDSEAKAEGFSSLGAFGNAWDRINKHALAQHEVWRVEFELA